MPRCFIRSKRRSKAREKNLGVQFHVTWQRARKDLCRPYSRHWRNKRTHGPVWAFAFLASILSNVGDTAMSWITLYVSHDFQYRSTFTFQQLHEAKRVVSEETGYFELRIVLSSLNDQVIQLFRSYPRLCRAHIHQRQHNFSSPAPWRLPTANKPMRKG